MRRRYNYFLRIAEAAAQDRALRMIAALIALATPELTSAADPNLKATLSCELVDEGRRTKLPAKRGRLAAPVECEFSVAGTARPEPFAARLITTWIDYNGAKAVPKKSDRLSGTVNGGAPWTVQPSRTDRERPRRLHRLRYRGGAYCARRRRQNRHGRKK